MFKFDKPAERALGESLPRSDHSGVAVAGWIGVLRRAAVALAVGSTLLVAGVQTGVAHADQYPPGSIYGTQYGVVPSDSVPGGQVDTLTNKQTGMVADDANNSGSAGTQMIQWPANNGYNQNWVFVPSTGANAGYDEIQNRQSGLCLDVSGASTAQDAPVIQWTCSGNANQQWRVEATAAPGASVIENENSGGDLAVAGGENDGNPGQGAGLVQDVDNSNYTDTWTVSPVSYRILTDLENVSARGDLGGNYYINSQYDATEWACTSGYHFRMASTGTYDSINDRWKTLPQAEIDQALSPETGVSSTDNTISTQQSPDGGQFPFISPELSESEYNTLAQEPLSWTNATVSSSEGNGVSDSDPAAANAGDGTVSLSYGYTAVYQGMDLTGQVYLHCDPNS
ncbi:MAG: RICIN domain-containing protein [Solirubrobacteraceae bacterium]